MARTMQASNDCLSATLRKPRLTACGRSATVGRRSLIRRLMSVSQRSLADPFLPVANGRFGEVKFFRE